MEQNREELLKHLAASLKDAKEDGGAILLVGAGISVSAGIPPAQQLMKIAIKNFPNYFTEEEQNLAEIDLSKLQYNQIMSKLSPMHRKALFEWHIKGDKKRNIPPSKLNFAHLAITELLKQGYIKRILTTNFDPLLINACYMVGMYPLPAIYDIGSTHQINPELFDDPCILYLNGQHAGQVQRNTSSQLDKHDPILQKVVAATGCKRPWIVVGYSGENDPLMKSLENLSPYNNWLYWLEYGNKILEKDTHVFLKTDEQCKVIYNCDADKVLIEITNLLNCKLDFIEHPAKEFLKYHDFIDFDTTHDKKNTYLKKMQTAIQLLTRISNEPEFSNIDILDERIAHLEKRIQRKNINDTNMIESILKECQDLNVFDPTCAVIYFYWGNLHLELAKKSSSQKESLKYINLAQNKYDELFKYHTDPSQLVYFHYFEILTFKARLITNTKQREELLKLALETSNNKKLQTIDFIKLNFENARISATLGHDIQTIIKYLEASPFLPKPQKNKLTALSSFSYLDQADVDNAKELNPYRKELKFQQWYRKTFEVIDIQQPFATLLQNPYT